MTLLLIGIAAWLLLAVFVCALGRAAKAADEHELERLHAGSGEAGFAQLERGGSVGAA